MRFRVKAGSHIGAGRRLYKKGDIVEDSRPLNVMFREKFDVVGGEEGTFATGENTLLPKGTPAPTEEEVAFPGVKFSGRRPASTTVAGQPKSAQKEEAADEEEDDEEEETEETEETEEEGEEKKTTSARKTPQRRSRR